MGSSLRCLRGFNSNTNSINLEIESRLAKGDRSNNKAARVLSGASVLVHLGATFENTVCALGNLLTSGPQMLAHRFGCRQLASTLGSPSDLGYRIKRAFQSAIGVFLAAFGMIAPGKSLLAQEKLGNLSSYDLASRQLDRARSALESKKYWVQRYKDYSLNTYKLSGVQLDVVANFEAIKTAFDGIDKERNVHRSRWNDIDIDGPSDYPRLLNEATKKEKEALVAIEHHVADLTLKLRTRLELDHQALPGLQSRLDAAEKKVSSTRPSSNPIYSNRDQHETHRAALDAQADQERACRAAEERIQFLQSLLQPVAV